LVESYASKKDIDIKIAYIIGEGLKHFLFYNDVYDMTVENLEGGDRMPDFSIDRPSSISQSQIKESPYEKIELEDVGKGNTLSTPDESMEELQEFEPVVEEEEEPIVEQEQQGVVETESSYCKNILDLPKEDFLSISILTDILRSGISGSIIKNPDDYEKSKTILQSELFVNYIQNIKIKDIFYSDIQKEQLPISEFREKTSKFLIETGNIIILDRGEESVNTEMEEIREEVPPIVEPEPIIPPLPETEPTRQLETYPPFEEKGGFIRSSRKNKKRKKKTIKRKENKKGKASKAHKKQKKNTRRKKSSKKK
jgi:hypothetical protein